MSVRSDLFIDVLLPLALPQLYTYRVPQRWNDYVLPGGRVTVQFGKSKLYSALVMRVHETAPKYTAKYIEDILDAEPILFEEQLKLWEWMSEYYMCTRGEVMLAALPSGLRLSSETKIVLHPELNEDAELSDDDHLMVDALRVSQILTTDQLASAISKKSCHTQLRDLLKKRVVVVYEELQERYKPKTETTYLLHPDLEDESALRAVFTKLEQRAFKQLEALMCYLRLSGKDRDERIPVRREEMLKLLPESGAAINELVKKQILVRDDIAISRLVQMESKQTTVVLSEEQSQAYHQIKTYFESIDTVLLHGVTASGKTEVYIKLMNEQLQAGKQVLFLLPEIALTTQLIKRLQAHFGGDVLVYHSKFNEQERVEIWNEVSKGLPKIVVGARSGLFLPYRQLGLIIIDEEHDPSFKQSEPSPRYNARESALWYARLFGAKVVLGSATPAVESYYLAKQGKFGLVEMHQRYGGAPLPVISVIDIREATRKKLMKSHFSPYLFDRMEQVIAQGKQVILFQNRRGFAPSIECQDCAHIPQCVRCDVSLTYHKNSDQLRCHYCGYSIPPPVQCEACGSTDLKMKGFGTEKIEEELQLMMGSARVARLDLDTTRTKNSMQQIVTDFEQQKTNVLVGTQMVTKGLDFSHVSLVGVLNADQLMNYPDFRSFERSFQLMSQVAGRAGRRDVQGEVVIQTFHPDHFVIQCVVEHDYKKLYTGEIADRMQFHYPPFYRLIRLIIKSKDYVLLDNAAMYLSSKLKERLADRVLGPEAPPVGKVRDEYLRQFMIKLERDIHPKPVKLFIQNELLLMKSHKDFKSIKTVVDVDPM